MECLRRHTILARKAPQYMICATCICGLTTLGVGAPATRLPPKDIVAVGKYWFYHFRSNNVDRSHLDSRMNIELTAAMVSKEARELRTLGRPLEFFYVNQAPVGNAMAYNLGIIFQGARVVESVVLDPDGKLAGVGFRIFAEQHGAE